MTTDSVDKIPELTHLFKKCQRIVHFLKYKGAEVTSNQSELRALLESIPEDIILDGQDYGPTFNDPSTTTSIMSDNVTRWNLKFIMINYIYPNREAIRSLLYEHRK